jgi:hypothetical protein
LPNNGKKPGQTRWESVLADSAADERDESVSSYLRAHSITSSARASSVRGSLLMPFAEDHPIGHRCAASARPAARAPQAARSSHRDSLDQPSDGRMTQNITPLFGPTCLGAQT